MSDVTVTPVSAPASAAPVRTEVVAPQPEVQVPAPEAKADGAAPETKVETKPDEPKLGQRFAQLSKRERELLQKEQALKEREEKVSPLTAALTAKDKRKLLDEMQTHGITFEDLTEFILNEGEETPPPAPTVSDEVKALREKIEAKEKAEQEARDAEAKKATQTQIDNFKASIKSAAESKSDEYKYVNKLEQHSLVYDVILGHHAEHGEVLPIEEALKLTETYLRNEAAKIKAVEEISAPAAPQASPAGQEPKTRFTLGSAAQSPTAIVPTGPLTPEQRRERTISMLRFK
jgi:hypothetical protein